jgi:hypothetical protein
MDIYLLVTALLASKSVRLATNTLAPVSLVNMDLEGRMLSDRGMVNEVDIYVPYPRLTLVDVPITSARTTATAWAAFTRE